MYAINDRARKMGLSEDTPLAYLTIGQLAAIFFGDVQITPAAKEDIGDRPIDLCGFSARLTNALASLGVRTASDISAHTRLEYIRCRNVGKNTFRELRFFMQAHNIKFAEDR